MSDIDIRKKLGPFYANIAKNPALKSGQFKPGLKAACDNYDRKIDACEALVKRKKSLLSEKLDVFVKSINDLGEKNKTLKAERDKAYAENGASYTAAANEFNAAKAKGDKADPADVVKKLQDLLNSFKKGVEQDKEHADKKEKLGLQVVADLKKHGDSYEKETKDIESATKQLTADGKSLEAQVRAIVVNYQATAKNSKDPKLQTDLTKLQTDLQSMLEALETTVV